jgi:hypothetical protein
MFQKKRLDFSPDNVLGLNISINTRTQFKIGDLTADFLMKASLTNIV